MGEPFRNILVIQTAFIGDAILTLPLLQTLKKNFPNSLLDVVVVPRTAEVFSHHPAISNIITFDKRRKDKGFKGFWRILTQLRTANYDAVIVPHRSLRSALLTWMLKPTVSIGFDRSAGRRLFTRTVRYEPALHEIDRNLSLLNSFKLPKGKDLLPSLYPSREDCDVIDSMLKEFHLDENSCIVAVAPGTIWNTKRWPVEKFATVCSQLSDACDALLLIGGNEDHALCKEIISLTHKTNVRNTAGRLSLLRSAELIRRCKVLLSNDSAPLHLAAAVRTPVIAIFGATVPEFGFAPRGPRDSIIEVKGLTCRPCTTHGGKTCPIKTFECMLAINPEDVIAQVIPFLNEAKS